MSIYDEIQKRNYKVVYVPHEIIKDYNACYNVIYDEKIIRPPAAEELGIPLNEIWISENGGSMKGIFSTMSFRK